MLTAAPVVAPSLVVVDEARRAFELLLPAIEGLPTADVKKARIDVQIAGAIAHSVAIRDAFPESPRRARFEALARAGFYEAELLDRLPKIALAAWYARYRQLATMAVATAATVPEAVIKEGQLLKARMLKVLDYWHGDDVVIAATLAAIRAGTGFQDLANDESNLADLYEREDVRAGIPADDKNFRLEDIAKARGIAQAIFKGLGLTEEGEAGKWTNLTHRAWTILWRDYDEHCGAGGFLFREFEDPRQTYPNLIGAVRAPAQRSEVEVTGTGVATPVAEPVPTPS